MRPRQKLVSVLLFTTAPLVAPACMIADDDGATHEVEYSDEEAPVELLALRTDLLQTQRDAALAAMPRFRPLCDAEGYPLVGNVASKVAAVGFQPSEFCTEVRKQQ